ncbi:MAG: zinc ribbon domain-containing protein [Anaerolineae bacterium]|nr:zinc ribbon domain-containing protein [Anaerolineae bacterium]
MPDYDYLCQTCHKRFVRFIPYQDYGKVEVACPHCGSLEVQRRIGRIRVTRSEDSRLESFSDMDDLDGLEEDPRALGRMMRKMSSEVGEEMGSEFNEVVDRLEAGQSPDDIEQSLPDYFDDGSDAASGFDDF